MIDYCMKVAVCDDDPKDLQNIASLARDIASREGIACDFTLYESSMSLLKAIEQGVKYHTLLLDVLMDEMGGMALASALRRQGNQASIVFISSNRELALQGYEVSAVRYLAKPIQPVKLSEALMVCYQAGKDTKEILLPTANGQRRISLENLMYAEAWDRGIRLFMTDGQVDVSVRMLEFERLLPDQQFVLCHRAYIVNMGFVQNIKRYELELKDGTSLLVSKYRFMEVKEKLVAYLKA